MGYAKNRMIEEQEQGWSFADGEYACDECVTDDGLRGWIAANATEAECTYCGRAAEEAIAVEVNDLFAFMDECIRTEYDEAIDWYSYDEGEIVGSWQDSYDLADELEVFDNDGLRQEFIDSFANRMFCPRDPYGLAESEAFSAGWQRFVEHVKHKSRFYFLTASDAHPDRHWSYDGMEVREVPSYLGESVVALDLVKTVSSETVLYRARIHDGARQVTGGTALGTAPQEFARAANRMSPSGVPMFYSAFDRQTALNEAYDPLTDPEQTNVATVGAFRPSRALRVVDLSEVVRVPSLFDESARQLREKARLINAFRQDISLPVVRDGREHVEYVPTQVVAEYLRYRFPEEHRRTLDGILYPSARTGGANCVLFVENDHCVDAFPGGSELYLVADLSAEETVGPDLLTSLQQVPV